MLLRKQYLAEKETRKPEQRDKDPVLYATDHVEQAAKYGTMLIVKKTIGRSQYRKKVVSVPAEEAGEPPEQPENNFLPEKAARPASMELTVAESMDSPDFSKTAPSEISLRQKQVGEYKQKELRRNTDSKTQELIQRAEVLSLPKQQYRWPKSRQAVAENKSQNLRQTEGLLKTKQYLQQLQLSEKEHWQGDAAQNRNKIIKKQEPSVRKAKEARQPDFAKKQNQAVFCQSRVRPSHVQAVSMPEKGIPMKRFAQKRMQQKLVQMRVLQKQRKHFTLLQFVKEVSVGTVRGILATAHTLLLASSGMILLVTVLLIAMLSMVAASPFGIFFSTNESAEPGTMSISAAAAMVNQEFAAKLEAIQLADAYAEVEISGEFPDLAQVIVVFAVKAAGNELATAADVITIDKKKLAELQAVFWAMTDIRTQVVTRAVTIDGQEQTEKMLQITISTKSAQEMANLYSFTARQKKALEELLAQKKLLAGFIGSTGVIDADASELLENLPENLSTERREVVQAAASLVGKVNYFWGGKSLTLGWNSAWGELRKVTAAGSPTTGNYRPYGLDCSGFVDWVFYNAKGGNYVIGQGGGVKSQRANCKMISWSEALPGDLVFYEDNSHIGIVGGRDAAGNLQIIQCASGANNVVITGVGKFASVGRPLYFAQ